MGRVVSLTMSEAHRRLQAMLADFDKGREITYSDFADEIMALASSVECIRPQTQGDMSDENSVIWRRISAVVAIKAVDCPW